MEKIERWKAYDGAMFREREDCFLHELKLIEQEANGKLKFFNNALFELTNGTYKTKLERAAYILIGNEAALKFVTKLGEHYQIVTPDEVGFWVYNKSGHYHSVQCDINFFKDKIRILEKYLQLVEKKDFR